MVLFGNKKTNWEAVKKEMAKPDFIKRINDIERNGVTQVALTKLQNYVNQEGFKNENLNELSSVAAKISKFILAIVQFNKVSTVVKNK